MPEVVTIDFQEKVRLDSDKMCALYYQLGAAGAEDVICRAMEELAVRLTEISKTDLPASPMDSCRELRLIAAIADQVGMAGLAKAARNVCECLNQNDPAALAATRARLERVGDVSLLEIWDVADLSV